MVVIMRIGCSQDEIGQVVNRIEAGGLKAHISESVDHTIIGVLGKVFPELRNAIEMLPGVEQAIPVTKPYKLASRETHPQDTIVKINDVAIGGNEIVVMAGPCAVESEEQALTIARLVKKFGAQVFRGGAFKPRTSPYSFQGLGEEGLKILNKVREETGLLIVTEATDHINIEAVEQYADIIQIGARNMQNYSLLRRAGRASKPILLKRGFAATIEEWLMSAEYIISEGNNQVVLCERGIRTFAGSTRNTLDLSAIPSIKEVSHLPVVVDPSHAAGRRDYVISLSKGAIAAGADGLLVEVHHDPPNALSDGMQSLYPEQFRELMKEI